jgi:hypothetical protein
MKIKVEARGQERFFYHPNRNHERFRKVPINDDSNQIEMMMVNLRRKRQHEKSVGPFFRTFPLSSIQLDVVWWTWMHCPESIRILVEVCLSSRDHP